MSTMVSEQVAPLARRQIPLWAAAIAVLAALLAGFLLGKPGDSSSGQPALKDGVVSLIDTEQGLVCLSPPGEHDQECYRAPGVDLQLGDHVRYSLEPQPVDAASPERGNQQVVVYAEPEDNPQ